MAAVLSGSLARSAFQMMVFGHAARARDPETKIRRDGLSRIRGRSAGKRWPGSVLAVHEAWTGADGCLDLPRPPLRRWRRSSRAPASSHGLGSDDAWDPESARPSAHRS